MLNYNTMYKICCKQCCDCTCHSHGLWMYIPCFLHIIISWGFLMMDGRGQRSGDPRLGHGRLHHSCCCCRLRRHDLVGRICQQQKKGKKEKTSRPLTDLIVHNGILLSVKTGIGQIDWANNQPTICSTYYIIIITVNALQIIYIHVHNNVHNACLRLSIGP